MKILILVILSFLITNKTKSQNNLYIIDQVSKKPIPFASAVLINKNVGTYSNDSGKIFSFFKLKDTVHISSIGYNKLIYIFNDKLSDTVYLKRKQLILDGIVIQAKRYNNEIKLGDFNKNSNNSMSLINGYLICTKIESQKNISGVLKSIKFKLKFYNNNNQQKLRLRFFENFNDSIPGEELCHENIIFDYINLKKNNNIDLEKYKIQFPKKGIFVGFETILIDEKERAKIGIACINSFPNCNLWFSYIEKKWYNSCVEIKDETMLKPFVQLVVKY